MMVQAHQARRACSHCSAAIIIITIMMMISTAQHGRTRCAALCVSRLCEGAMGGISTAPRALMLVAAVMGMLMLGRMQGVVAAQSPTQAPSSSPAQTAFPALAGLSHPPVELYSPPPTPFTGTPSPAQGMLPTRSPTTLGGLPMPSMAPGMVPTHPPTTLGGLPMPSTAPSGGNLPTDDSTDDAPPTLLLDDDGDDVPTPSAFPPPTPLPPVLGNQMASEYVMDFNVAVGSDGYATCSWTPLMGPYTMRAYHIWVDWGPGYSIFASTDAENVYATVGPLLPGFCANIAISGESDHGFGPLSGFLGPYCVNDTASDACSSAPLLTLRESGPWIDTDARERLSVHATVGHPCNGSASEITTTWTSQDPNIPLTATGDPTKLVVEAGLLTPGATYIFTVSSWLTRDAVQASSLDVYVFVSIGSVVAVIDGGDWREVSPGKDADFTASRSHDLDDPSAPLYLKWELFPDTGASPLLTKGFGAFPVQSHAAKFTIPSGTLAAENTYFLVLTAKRGSDGDFTGLYNASSTHTITLDAINAPAGVLNAQITLQNPTAYTPHATVSWGNKLVLEDVSVVSLSKGGTLNRVWSVPNAFVPATHLSTDLAQSFLTLSTAHASVVPDQLYTFSLDLTDMGSFAHGAAELSVFVNGPPTGGWVNLSTNNATAWAELVTMTAVNFTDHDLPLLYSFSQRTNGGGGGGGGSPIVLSVQTTLNTHASILSASVTGTTVRVVALCEDDLGATANAFAPLVLHLASDANDGSGAVTKTALDGQLINAAEKVTLLFDGEAALATVSSVAAALDSSALSAQEVADLQVTALLLTRNATSVSDKGDRSVLEQINTAVHQTLGASSDPDMLLDEALEPALEITATLLDAYQQQGVLYSSAMASASFEIEVALLDKIADNDTLEIAHGQQLWSLVDKLGDAVLRDVLSPGEQPHVFSSSVVPAATPNLLEISVEELDSDRLLSATELRYVAPRGGANGNISVPTSSLGAVHAALAACGGSNVGVVGKSWGANLFTDSSFFSSQRTTLLNDKVATLAFRDCNFAEVPIDGIDSTPAVLDLDLPLLDLHTGNAARFVLDNDTALTEGVQTHQLFCNGDKPEHVEIECNDTDGNGTTTSIVEATLPCEAKDQQFNVTCPTTWWTLSCRFFNTSTEVWATDGCTPVSWSQDVNRLRCTCSHLTDFTAAGERYSSQSARVVGGAADTNKDDFHHNLGVVIALASLWFVYLTALAVGRRIDVREDTEQIIALRRMAGQVDILRTGRLWWSKSVDPSSAPQGDNSQNEEHSLSHSTRARSQGSRSAAQSAKSRLPTSPSSATASVRDRRTSSSVAPPPPPPTAIQERLRADSLASSSSSPGARRGTKQLLRSARSPAASPVAVPAEEKTQHAAEEEKDEDENEKARRGSLRQIWWSALLEEHALLSLVPFNQRDRVFGLRFRYKATVLFCECMTILVVAVFLYERQLVSDEWVYAFQNSSSPSKLFPALQEALWEAAYTLLIYLPIHVLLYRGFQRICRARVSAAMFAEQLFLSRDRLLAAPLENMSVAELESAITRLAALRKICKSEAIMLRKTYGADSPEVQQFQHIVVSVRSKHTLARRILRTAQIAIHDTCMAVMHEELEKEQYWWGRARVRRIMEEWQEKLQQEAEHRKLLDCLSNSQRMEYVQDQLVLSSLRRRGVCGRLYAGLFEGFLVDSTLYEGFYEYKAHKLKILGVAILWMIITTVYIALFAFEFSSVGVLHALLNLSLALLLDLIILSPLYIALVRVVLPTTVVKIVRDEWSEASLACETYLTDGSCVDNGRLAALLSEHSTLTRKGRLCCSQAAAPSHTRAAELLSPQAVARVRRLSLGRGAAIALSAGLDDLGGLGEMEQQAETAAAGAGTGAAGESLSAIARANIGLFDAEYMAKRQPAAQPMHAALTREADIVYVLWRGLYQASEVVGRFLRCSSLLSRQCSRSASGRAVETTGSEVLDSLSNFSDDDDDVDDSNSAAVTDEGNLARLNATSRTNVALKLRTQWCDLNRMEGMAQSSTSYRWQVGSPPRGSPVSIHERNSSTAGAAMASPSAAQQRRPGRSSNRGTADGGAGDFEMSSMLTMNAAAGVAATASSTASALSATRTGYTSTAV